MDAYVVSLMCLLLGWLPSMRPECVPKVAVSDPHSSEMNATTYMIDSSTHTLECCLKGFEWIVWTFRKKKEVTTSEVICSRNGVYDLSEGNRSLTIINPMVHQHTGYYRWQGTRVKGTIKVYGEIYVKVVLRLSNLGFNITRWSHASVKAFARGGNQTLFCIVTAFPSFAFNFMWYYKQGSQYLPLLKEGPLTYGRRRASLIRDFKGSSQISIMSINKDNLSHNLSLTLTPIVLEGAYICQAEQAVMGNLNETFHVYFRKINPRSVYMLIGVISASLMVLLAASVFKYDLLIFVKSTIRLLVRDDRQKKYNFFFLYNDDDNNDVKVIHHVIKNLEFQGFSTYFHSRDQKYGEDTFQSLIGMMEVSDLIVIWTSCATFDSPMRAHCVDTVITHFSRKKRLYVIVNSKTVTKDRGLSKSVTADLNACVTSKWFLRISADMLVKSKANMYARWTYRTFLSWLISSLPIQSADIYSTK